MKFLLDACAASRSMQTTLTALGHDVLSETEYAPRAIDEDLLTLAPVEEQVLITEDKDFGELVFVRRLPQTCIIRFGDMSVAEKVAAMQQLPPLRRARRCRTLSSGRRIWLAASLLPGLWLRCQ